MSGQVGRCLPPRHLLFKLAMFVPLRGGWALVPSVSTGPVCFRPSASAGCLQHPLCLSPIHCYTPFQAPRESFLSRPHHANICVNIVSVAFCNLEGKKLSPLAWFVSPILSYTPTQKATFLSIPHPSDLGPHTDTLSSHSRPL